MSPHLYPVFLKLEGRAVLLVGGGRVATEKLPALLRAGACVTVVAPRVSSEIAASLACVQRRRFRSSDLDGQWFVVSAAPPHVNEAVVRAAATREVFVNAVDDAARATAYLGGVVRRSEVTVAISTAGLAPALAGLLREGLDALLPSDLTRWVAHATQLRRRQRRTGVPMAARRPQLLDALVRLYASRDRRAS